LKQLFISDCEGPISKNDNAYELTEHFIPNGDKLFANISRYDDVLAAVFAKLGYTAGSTLKLVLPFFKAYDITDQQIEEFSAQNILLIADTKTTLRHVQAVADAFIVSTSYEHYIRSLCKAVGFPYKNTYCTKVRLDKYQISPQEKTRLREVAQEISQMPRIAIPAAAKSVDDFSLSDQEAINRLDEIFWSELPEMSLGRLLEVVTVGGEQKAESIRDAAKRLDADLADVMYVGDSITDVEALKLVHAADGLSVSFNGNSYAVQNAEVSVQSESNLVTAVLADLFFKQGKTKALSAVADWNFEALKSLGVDEALLKQFQQVSLCGLPKVQIVTAQNMQMIIEESSVFRKKVRGVNIGRLG
jgi:energy-converting hydrogenase A subunit R